MNWTNLLKVSATAAILYAGAAIIDELTTPAQTKTEADQAKDTLQKLLQLHHKIDDVLSRGQII